MDFEHTEEIVGIGRTGPLGVFDELPRTASGKIQKFQFQDTLTGRS